MSDQKEHSAGSASNTHGHSRFGSVVSTRPKPIEVERSPPFDRWFHKALHYWRYGYSHPDEDLLGVIEAVGDVLHVQILTARAILTDDESVKKADAINRELDEEVDKPLPDFSTLLGFEARINALYPPELDKRRQWVIRDRFERVAPPGAVQYWQMSQLQSKAQQNGTTRAEESAAEGDDATKADSTAAQQQGGGKGGGDAGGGGSPPPSGESPLTPGQADSQALLGYIHANYLMTIGREKAVRDLKRWLLMHFWSFLLWLVPALVGVWLVLWWNEMGEYWGLLLGLFLIAAVGRAGATTSVINRLQKAISANILAADPIVELTALRTGKNEISMALLSSSIFALLMWAFFASGVPSYLGFDGGLFPRSAAAAARASVAQAQTQPQLISPQSDAPEGSGTGGSANSNASTTAEANQGGSSSPPETATTGPGKSTGGAAAPRTAPLQAATLPATTQPDARDAAGLQAEGVAPLTIRPYLRPDVHAQLNRAEADVNRNERRYREFMAQLDATEGSWNLLERGRLRGEARAAISYAVLRQQSIVTVFETGRHRAENENRLEAVRRWNADVADATARRASLEEMRSTIDTVKPAPSVSCPQNKECNPFRSLATQLRLNDETDFFKMLLWAFIAGFAERFVPDMLDRVIARGRGPTATESDSMIAAQVRSGMVPGMAPGAEGHGGGHQHSGP